MPPAIVLEVLRILKGEVDLRELTRVTEQQRQAARPNVVEIEAEQTEIAETEVAEGTEGEPQATAPEAGAVRTPEVEAGQAPKEEPELADTYAERAEKLERSQEDLRRRTEEVIRKVNELQVREKKRFPRELSRLTRAEAAMRDARILLSEPDTGPEPIAAETEAIEALLASRRSSGGGGGGGSDPGGGTGGGVTELAAVSLIGTGLGDAAPERVVQQASGAAGSSGIPDEFRETLDAYFGALEGTP